LAFTCLNEIEVPLFWSDKERAASKSNRENSMTRRDVIGLLTAVSALVLTGCGEVFPKRFRFKMTVEVETPLGLRTGSGVMEMSAANVSFQLPDSHAVDLKFKGEAVPVDLPGGTLFALIGMDEFEAMVIDTFDPSAPRAKKLVALFGELGSSSSIGRRAELTPAKYPKLVRFRDIRDPKTVELVDPGDLGKSFGAGIKLRRISFAVVDEPVTIGIEKRLVWLMQTKNGQLDGGRYDSFSSLANSLNILNFKSLEMIR
jgi:hypothetical protein